MANSAILVIFNRSVIIFFEAERFGFLGDIVPLSVAIFMFLKKKHKGFPLQSGLRREILHFCNDPKRKRVYNRNQVSR